MKCTYPETCIYFHAMHESHNKPSVRIVCDYRDGLEIRLIPNEEINNCQHFKTFKQIKENNKKYFQLTT